MMWTTKDGDKINIRDLTDRHLLNIERMIKRSIRTVQSEERACASFTFNGEMAQMCQERDMMDLVDKECLFGQVYMIVLQEIKRRDIPTKFKKPNRIKIGAI